jgi:ABC-type uncharacterized transport system auxiliary subunit
MNRHWLWGLLVASLLGGCLGQRQYPTVHYYSLDSAAAIVQRTTRPWPVVLGIRPFTAATRYRHNMLYRLSEVEVSFYPDDRWVEPPEEMLSRVITEMLQTSGLFQQATSAEDLPPTAWMLSGEVVRFDEVRTASTRQAECWVRLELRRVRDEQLLWSGMLTAVAPLAAPTPAALASAMSQAVQDVAQQLITQLAGASPQFEERLPERRNEERPPRSKKSP